jgi:hypothetical protein
MVEVAVGARVGSVVDVKVGKTDGSLCGEQAVTMSNATTINKWNERFVNISFSFALIRELQISRFLSAL